jgi:hypothetical protein
MIIPSVTNAIFFNFILNISSMKTRHKYFENRWKWVSSSVYRYVVGQDHWVSCCDGFTCIKSSENSPRCDINLLVVLWLWRLLVDVEASSVAFNHIFANLVDTHTRVFFLLSIANNDCTKIVVNLRDWLSITRGRLQILSLSFFPFQFH